MLDEIGDGDNNTEHPLAQDDLAGNSGVKLGDIRPQRFNVVLCVSSYGKLAADLVHPSQWDKVGKDISQAKEKGIDAVVGAIGSDPTNSKLYKTTNFLDRPTGQKVVQGAEKLLGGVSKASESKTVGAVSIMEKVAEDVVQVKGKTR